MPIESNLAGVVRVAYEAVTGEFNRDVDVAARNYAGANEQMSDSAIKLELAQDRLRRAVAKGPSASREQARALLSVRQAERELRQETDRTTTSITRQDRAIDRLGRGGGIGRMRSNVVGLVAGLTGGAGLVYAFDQAKDAASNTEEQVDKTRRVFGAAAGDVERYAKGALGLANDQALEFTSTLGALLRPIGLVGRAGAQLSIDLIKRGVDLSSFYNRDVKESIEAVRSGIVGEAEPLRSFGVRLSEARVQALALLQTGKDSVKQLTDEEKVRARVAIIFKDSRIAAGNYRDTIKSVANQEREASSNMRDTQAAIGRALLPGYRDALRGVNEWLASAENQRRVQVAVTDAVELGEKAVRGFGAGLDLVRRIAEPVVGALGGIENTVKALTVLWVAHKTKALLGFAGTAAASRRTAASMTADAAAAGRAWDIATRPRNMVVSTTVTGGGAVGGAGRGRGGTTTTTRGRGRTPVPIIPLPGVGAVLTGALIADALTGGHGTAFVAQGISGGKDLDVEALKRGARAGKLTIDQLPELRAIVGHVGFTERDYNEVAGIIARRNARGAARRAGPEEGAARQSIAAETARRAARARANRNRPTGDGLTTMQRAELAASDAELTVGLQDDLAAARRLEAIYRRRAEAEGLKGKALFEARQNLNAARGRTQAIEQQIADDEREADEKAEARRKAAAEKARERRRKAIAAERERVREFERTTAEQRAASAKSSQFAQWGWGAAAAAAKPRDPRTVRQDGGRRDPETITRDELGGIFRDFLTSWVDLQGRQATSGGSGSFTTHVLEDLTRKQTQVLVDGLSSPRRRRVMDEGLMG